MKKKVPYHQFWTAVAQPTSALTIWQYTQVNADLL